MKSMLTPNSSTIENTGSSQISIEGPLYSKLAIYEAGGSLTS